VAATPTDTDVVGSLSSAGGGRGIAGVSSASSGVNGRLHI